LITSPQDLGHIAALVIHGDADDRLPPYWAEQSISLLKELGVPLQFLHYPIGHEITRDVAADFANWVRDLIPR
jgi:phospholipase/carboxylesterase